MIRPAVRPIHLDTSFLIRSLDRSFPESDLLRGWLLERRTIAVSALAWGEFLCGPLNAGEAQTGWRIAHTIVPIGHEEAEEAARLFNHGGRRRNSFPDCVIAATAILADAELATSNAGDFERFRDAGLDLAE